MGRSIYIKRDKQRWLSSRVVQATSTVKYVFLKMSEWASEGSVREENFYSHGV